MQKTKEFWLERFNEYGRLFGEDAVEYFIPEKGYQNSYNFLIENGFVTKEKMDAAIALRVKTYGEKFVKETEDISAFLDIANEIADADDSEPDPDEYYNWAAAFLASDYATEGDRQGYLDSLGYNKEAE